MVTYFYFAQRDHSVVEEKELLLARGGDTRYLSALMQPSVWRVGACYYGLSIARGDSNGVQ